MVARGPRLATARYALTWSRLALAKIKFEIGQSLFRHATLGGFGARTGAVRWWLERSVAARFFDFGDGVGGGVLAGSVADFQHFESVSWLDCAALEHDAENSFAWEDTIAREIVNGAPRVAHFANLRDLDNHVFADFDLGAHGHVHYVDAFGAEVLGEIAFFHIKSHSLGALNGFPGKK